MPSPFAAAGALSEPSEYAPLSSDRYFTGLVTQRSALRDAAVPFLYEKFYSAGRIDSLWDGANVEISADLTLVRRPGLSVYNAQLFPPVTRFFKHRLVVDGVASVRVIADTAAAVYDATGPNTKTLLWSKGPGASSKTCFQSVGNTLYFSTGTEQRKWLVASQAWASGKSFSAGDWIVDPGNNIQLVLPQQTAQIVSVGVSAGILTVQFAGRSPFAPGTVVTLSGVTEASWLNGQSATVTSGNVRNGIRAVTTHADYPLASDTGVASSGVASGVTGATAPAWSSTVGTVVSDGGLQWTCWGSAVQSWGLPTPTAPPSVAQAALPSSYETWAASTYYSTSLALVDPHGNVQVLSRGGTLGSAEPAWATALDATTSDGTALWTCNGTDAWEPSTNYSTGDLVLIAYTYYVAVTDYTPSDNAAYRYGYGNAAPTLYATTVQVPVTVTELFRCTQPGTSGLSAPDWSSAPGVGSAVSDNTTTWANVGTPLTWAALGAASKVSIAAQVVDANGYLETITSPGRSGSTVPAAWGASVGDSTTDGTCVWTNAGNYSAANTGTWQYVFAGKCSIDSSVGSASGRSVSIVLGQGRMAVLQGGCFTDPQIDTIVVFRTDQDGAQLLYLDEFAQPSGSTVWTYQDTSTDDLLDAEILAPMSGVNNPPPSGITALSFHLDRIWAAVDNRLYFCTGPDTTIGNGYTAWSESNQFGYPDAIVRLVPVTLTNGALLAFTASDVQSVFGLGTASSPFFPTTYAAGIGLLGPDALDVVGSTIHLFTTAGKQVSMDPSAGYTETGFPIGDQFEAVTTGGVANPTAMYSPRDTYVTWHEAGSGDTALYVADGHSGWFRYSPVSAPESGFMWSPRAIIEGNTSAVASIETSPGARLLLVGPPTAYDTLANPVLGPILFRDASVNADNGAAYADTYAVLGSMQLAQSGELAEIAHITLDSKRVGTAPTVALLLGEIAPTAACPFESLDRTGADPPLLPPSVTLFNDRFEALQNGVAPLCRHFQLKIQWASENAPSELLQHTVYGAKHGERRQQN